MVPMLARMLEITSLRVKLNVNPILFLQDHPFLVKFEIQERQLLGDPLQVAQGDIHAMHAL